MALECLTTTAARLLESGTDLQKIDDQLRVAVRAIQRDHGLRIDRVVVQWGSDCDIEHMRVHATPED